ncbi:MAG TPA: OmpA family protein [Vicinamibacterales bacterium]|nr:OmpA family protein [Vicinamibacterales bacterium]
MRKVVMAVAVTALVAGGSAACATKKFVRTSVGEVDNKVDSVSKSLEETQERTRQNEQRIGEVDTKADAAGKSAGEARQAADRVNARADAIERASKRLIYEVVLSEDQGNFKFGKFDLPDEAKGEIDTLVGQLKADPKGAWIEIEGHTDAVGGKQYNERLGLERAEAVKHYLYETHQVPLHKMNVISYGEDKPVAPNDTKDGRAQNRRVVIRVLT